MVQKISPEKVRYAKGLLLKGYSPVSIARALECSVETIRRYKRGESRSGVIVEGEEGLRPMMVLPPMEEVEEGQDGPVNQAEVDESLARLLAGINGLSEGELK
jgi:Putative ATPase subunit of terminase (gpP-like)